MKFKLLIYAFITCFVFLGCSKSGNDTVLTPAGPSWTLTVDGKNYNWSGPIVATASNNGQASYTASTFIQPIADIALSSTSVSGFPPQIISVQLSSVSTGTFNISPNSYTLAQSLGNSFTLILDNTTMYSSIFPGSDITFKVNSLSDKTLSSVGLTGVGYVKGTFSGTIADLFGVKHSISGTYNCVRLM
jgi:hypothetical protein